MLSRVQGFEERAYRPFLAPLLPSGWHITSFCHTPFSASQNDTAQSMVWCNAVSAEEEYEGQWQRKRYWW
jgi:hypothetical protein